MSTILVTGATGTLGKPLVQLLRDAGHDVRAMSRRSDWWAADLLTGAGLGQATAGADVVVHCATAPKKGADVEAARRLIAACKKAGVRHFVYISIVGVDAVPLGYYRSKLEVERLVEDSGIGWTTLRAAQFHDLVVQMLQALAKPPVMLIPKDGRTQPVAVEEVAARLAELAQSEPLGRVDDMGGPEVFTLRELAEKYLAATGRQRRIVEVPLAGKTYQGFVLGGHLAPERAVGKGTFDEFLAEYVRKGRDSEGKARGSWGKPQDSEGKSAS
ncbi:NAD(P)H-binding protein [Streptomyces sp. TRM66268-LWL]|uniref:NAD(P)H-binding protein n=1 Tax=Streptomyces polyasparticus TaxID=2767826 RepID=A0ABR7SSL0_9ACTN|nr:NAD(P)H-binding protein [Streptomyces polyasparticus]MBC9718485.1 NAD(P)H-binding protein [Streptomyces polyasparticus]